jgi:serine protease Do
MDPLQSGFWQKLKASRFSFSLVTLATLALGILIGTVVTYGVKGKTIDSSDAQQLTIPQAKQVSNAFSSVAKQLEPSVVNINTESVIKNPHRNLRPRQRPSPDNPGGQDDQGQDPDNPFQDFMDRFFGGQGGQMPDQQEDMRSQSLGSGVIVDSKGYIVTNYHVVERADKIRVSLMGDPPSVSYPAKVIGTDKETDLAVIKIDIDHPLPAAKLGNSDGMNVGDWVLAIGSPFGLEESVTAGIVSAKGRNIVPGRQFQSFIQTDAAINPGNSGGALVDVSGNLVGINSAIYSESGGNLGIGFAIPAALAKSVMQSIIHDGKVVRGWLGVQIHDLDAGLAGPPGPASGNGVAIAGIVRGGPADLAGMAPGDVITEVDGHPADSVGHVMNEIAALKPGTVMNLRVIRGTGTLALRVKVGERPALEAAPAPGVMP